MAKITIEEYAMGREEAYANEWALAKMNAPTLLSMVNAFLEELFPGRDFSVSSGFRPAAINSKITGAAKSSLHMIGKAIDIHDTDGFLKKNLTPNINDAHASALRKYGLFMEDPASTPTWCHLDIGDRTDRPSRIFKP